MTLFLFPWKYKGQYTLDNKLQQYCCGACCRDSSLCVHWRVFVKIFAPQQKQFCRSIMSRNNQIRQNLCDLLWRRNSVGETNIFTQILQYTRSGCRWDVSLPLADLPVHSGWSVAATYSLVSSDLRHSLYRLFSLVTAKCSASVTGNPSIVFFFLHEGF